MEAMWTIAGYAAYAHRALKQRSTRRAPPHQGEDETMSAESTEPIRSMVGARLRQLRLIRNLTVEAAAAAIGSSKPTISRMERGQAPLTRETLLALLTLYGVTDPAQQEVLVSVAVGERSPGWWDHHDVPLEETVIWSHEQAARLIRAYDPVLIPELLRTEEYARAADLARHYPSPPSEATEHSVKKVLRRQRARKAALWVVIDEAALWRPIGGDLDMHLRQLDALAAASFAQDGTIQIVPKDSPFLAPCTSFTIYRLPGKDILTLHLYTGDETTDLASSENYGLLFDQLAGVARLRAETPKIIAHVRDRLRSSPPPGGSP